MIEQHELCRSETPSRYLHGELGAGDESRFVLHLDGCDTCRARLERLAGDVDDWSTVRDVLSTGDTWPRQRTEFRPAPRFLAPTDDPESLGRIGTYEAKAVIGRGGFGVVFKAYDRSLGRNVAVKVLEPSFAHVAAARQRFAREAKAMAAVSHEHVVPVYAVDEHTAGEQGGGLPYFVMEYVAGGTLEGRLRDQGALDTAAVVAIGWQTALALAAAHRQGLVHRDIKPANILLDEGTERVRVADFGLARVANDVSCTRSGFLAGTPQYMAPEQVRGEPCDGQSDLFSLGAVMYEMAVGHAPFRADGVYAVMQRIVHDPPRGLREQNPGVPAWLEAFILKLLEKEPARRFSSAEEVAATLEAELAHLRNPTVVSRPDRAWSPVRRRSKDVFGRFALGAGVLAMAVTTLLVTWPGADRPEPRRPLPPNSPTPSVVEAPLTDLVTTPLWHVDGARELDADVRALESRTSSPAPDPYDVWMLGVRFDLERLEWLEHNPNHSPAIVSPKR